MMDYDFTSRLIKKRDAGYCVSTLSLAFDGVYLAGQFFIPSTPNQYTLLRQG